MARWVQRIVTGLSHVKDYNFNLPNFIEYHLPAVFLNAESNSTIPSITAYD